MSVPFVERNPSADEVEQIRLAMSSFCDGTGMLMQEGGATLPGWRDFERILAAVLGGNALENKAVFDVVVPSAVEGVDFGISVKSKGLARASALGDLAEDGRVYMELANSPAKFWEALRLEGLSEEQFKRRESPGRFGVTVLDLVQKWHLEAAEDHVRMYPSRKLDLSKCVHLVISYDRPRGNAPRRYQLHAFDMCFPDAVVWEYRSEKSLRGLDPQCPNEVLLDWYPLSGGQLKYYPRAKAARFSSPAFSLESPGSVQSVLQKSARLWPDKWPKSASGRVRLNADQLIVELKGLCAICEDEKVAAALLNVIRMVRSVSP